MDEQKIRIKILEYIDVGFNCDSCGPSYIVDNESDWDFVATEELQILKEWVQNNNKRYGNKIVIVTEKQIDIPKTVKEYNEKAKKDIQDKFEKEQKKFEKAEKRKKTIEKKKKDEEMKLLKELQSKYKVEVLK